MKVIRIASLVILLAALGVFTPGQNGRSQIDPEHSTASFYLQKNAESSSRLNVAVAKVSGIALWDRQDVSNSAFRLYLYPAGQDSQLFNKEGHFRVDAVANLARYTVMTFNSKHASMSPSGMLDVTGDMTVSYVERETAAQWSPSYTGSEAGPPQVQQTSREVHLVVQDVSTLEQTNWPAAKPDLVASIATSESEVPGIKHALLDAIWPIVVQDESCTMPPLSAGADLRDYHGADCVGRPVLVSPSGEIPAWSAAGYAGRVDANPAGRDYVLILIQLRLIEPSMRAGVKLSK